MCIVNRKRPKEIRISWWSPGDLGPKNLNLVTDFLRQQESITQGNNLEAKKCKFRTRCSELDTDELDFTWRITSLPMKSMKSVTGITLASNWSLEVCVMRLDGQWEPQSPVLFLLQIQLMQCGTHSENYPAALCLATLSSDFISLCEVQRLICSIGS